ncbi:hypothetical protein PHYSODRAFT_471142, partial [Phytophthora sojae]
IAISALHRMRVSLRANCDDPTSRQPTTSSSAEPVTTKKPLKTSAKASDATWKLRVRRTEAATPRRCGISRAFERASAWTREGVGQDTVERSARRRGSSAASFRKYDERSFLLSVKLWLCQQVYK